MTKSTALKRITNAVEREHKNERAEVKKYIIDLIYSMFIGLENDADADEHTSTQNINFALAINLEDEREDVLQEARREAEKATN